MVGIHPVAVKATPTQLYQKRSESAQTSGDWDAAIAARQAAIKLDPDDETLIQALAQTKADQKNGSSRAYQTQAEGAEESGDWEAAIAARQAAIKLSPENENSHPSAGQDKDLLRRTLNSGCIRPRQRDPRQPATGTLH